MKKHILALAITIIIVLVALIIYFAPKFMFDKEIAPPMKHVVERIKGLC